MSARFDAILFDFGGVFTGSPFHAVAGLAADLGTTADVLQDVIFGPYSSDTDHPWHQLERGEISIEATREAILELGAQRGIETDLWSFFGAMANSSGIRQELVDCVRGLRADGFRTGLLTNNVAEFREHWEKTLPLAELFDDVVDSSAVGMRKPDLRIFRLACERLQVEPSRAVFLDDHPGNVSAAKEAGLEALLVEADPAGALDALRALLG